MKNERRKWIGLCLCLFGILHLFAYTSFILQVHVQIKYPELTKKGMDFIESEHEQDFYIFPEADMLLSVWKSCSFSTASEWGKGWADPEIRRQRLGRKRTNRNGKKRKGKWRPKKLKSDQSTVRGRLATKLSKQDR